MLIGWDGLSAAVILADHSKRVRSLLGSRTVDRPKREEEPRRLDTDVPS